MTSKNSFWKLSGWNFKKRLWTAALCAVIWFFILPVSVFMEAGNYVQGLEFYQEAERLSELAWVKNCIINTTISGGGVYGAVVVGMAMLLALQGFGWINDQKKVDLYRSVPVKASARFWYINLNSLWIFLLSFGSNMILANVAAGIRGIWDKDFLNASVLSFFIHLLLFVAAYFIVLIAQTLTGNVVLGFCGASVFLLIEPACFLLKDGLMEFYHTYMNYMDTYESMGRGIFTPVSVFIRMYKSVSMKSGGFMDAANFDGIWKYAALMLLQAVVYGAVAYWLYTKRPAQTGGKAMIFSKTKPVIKAVIMIVGSLYLSILMASMADADNSKIWYGFFGALCGLVILQVVLQTIMEGNFKEALGGRISFLIAAGMTFAVYFVFACDLTGYDTYLPKEEKVESFALARSRDYQYSLYDMDGNYQSSIEYLLENMYITDQDAAEKLLSMLRQAIDKDEYYYHDYNATTYDGEIAKALEVGETAAAVAEDENIYEDGDCSEDLYVKFRLSGGREVVRHYYLKLDDIRNCWTYLYELPEYKEAVYMALKDETELAFFNRESTCTVSYHTYNLSTSDRNSKSLELVREFFDALKQDLGKRKAETVLTQVPVGNLNFSVTNYLKQNGDRISFDVPVYESDEATIAMLKREGWYEMAGIDPDQVSAITVYQYTEDDNGRGQDKVMELAPGDPLFEEVVSDLYLSSAIQQVSDPGAVCKNGYGAEIGVRGVTDNSEYGSYRYSCNFYVSGFPEGLEAAFEDIEPESDDEY